MLIWHSNVGNWQLRHAPLTDQTWFTMHVWSQYVWERKRRAEGVRGQNCKFESVTYHVIYLPSTPTAPLAPVLTCTRAHTQSHFHHICGYNIDLYFLTLTLTSTQFYFKPKLHPQDLWLICCIFKCAQCDCLHSNALRERIYLCSSHLF